MKASIRQFSLVFALSQLAALSVQAAECSAEKIAQILEPARAADDTVDIDCSTTLPANQEITKKVRFIGPKASGVTFDCNGSSINRGRFNKGGEFNLEVLSAMAKDAAGKITWRRPEDVTIRNCVVNGSVRISGMAINGEGEHLRASSRRAGHTERAQAAAPTRITLDRIKIIAQGNSPFYISPGVTYSKFINSEIGGRSGNVALYLDAESAYNEIRNNYIHSERIVQEWEFLGITVYQRARELMAIDGSAHNKIMNNHFAALNHGGLFIYRNCGEGGTIRHQTPSYNQIINNTFYYDKYDGSLPGVWVASRNGNRSYCEADAGFPFGSSVDNNDNPVGNVIAQNQFFKFNPQGMVWFSLPYPQLSYGGSDADDTLALERTAAAVAMTEKTKAENYMLANETVTSRIRRKAACFLPSKRLLLDGQSTEPRTVQRDTRCVKVTLHCDDGNLQKIAESCQ